MVTIRTISPLVRTGLSIQHFIPVVAHLVHCLAPLWTAIEDNSLLSRTGLLTGLSVPILAGPIHHIDSLLPLISLSASYWLLDCTPHILSAYICAPFFSPLKQWCPTTTLHGVTTQKTST